MKILSNQLDALNSAIASPLHSGYLWRGVTNPKRSADKIVMIKCGGREGHRTKKVNVNELVRDRLLLRPGEWLLLASDDSTKDQLQISTLNPVATQRLRSRMPALDVVALRI